MEDLEAGLDPNSLAAKLANPQPRPRPVEDVPVSRPAPTQRVGEDVSLAEWLRGFAGGDALKIVLERKFPKYWGGKQVSGILEHFDSLPEETEIMDRFGGGKYQIRISKQLPTGRWQFAGARTFEVAGDPKITGDRFFSDPAEREEKLSLAPAPADSDLSRHAMSMSERLAMEERARADRLESELRNQNKGLDPIMVQMLTRPYEIQVDTLKNLLAEKERIIAEKDRTIKELSEKKPETGLQDKLIEKMYDNETTKIEHLRAQFDAERRMLIANHQEELKRVEHRADMDKSNLIEMHRRELKTLENNYEARIKTLETAYEGRLDAKDIRVKDLERQITRQDSEINELRAKKEKSPMDTMKELVVMKESMDNFFGGNKEETEEPSTVERVIAAVAQNPIVQGIGARLANPEAAQPAGPRVRPQRQAPANSQGEVGSPGPALPPAAPPPPSINGVSAQEVAGAVQYMEGAVASGVAPETFAQSVRNVVPSGIVESIRANGIDAFIDQFVTDSGSPLNTQVGRNWLRKVGKVLVEPTE